MLGLALVRSYKYLALTSILGDIAVTAGICASLAYAFDYGHKPSVEPPFLKIQGVPQAASTLAFLFLIHAIVLPMAQSLKGDLHNPKKFERVAWWSMTFITVRCPACWLTQHAPHHHRYLHVAQASGSLGCLVPGTTPCCLGR